MPKLAQVLDGNLLRVQFDKKVRHGIFNPVARRLPVDIAEERLQDAICQTFEMYRRYALEKGKILPDAILVHYCRLRAVDPGRHFIRCDGSSTAVTSSACQRSWATRPSSSRSASMRT
jgi:predicted RNA polymerase sigma factor